MDFAAQFKDVFALAPVIPTDDTLQVGETIDTAGYLPEAIFRLVTGTLVDANATFTLKLFHGAKSDMSDEEECTVANGFLAGSGAFTFAADKATRTIQYLGGKQYLRVKVQPDGNTAAAPIAVVASLRKRVTK